MGNDLEEVSNCSQIYIQTMPRAAKSSDLSLAQGVTDHEVPGFP